MHKASRTIAVIAAVCIFFIMSIVGWFMGLEPATCCNRAVLGAVITYFVVMISAKAVTHIVINQMIESRAEKLAQKRTE